MSLWSTELGKCHGVKNSHNTRLMVSLMMDILRNKSPRPVHFTYVVNERKAPNFFFRVVMGMSVVRHDEMRFPVETNCPHMFDGRWSKTLYGFGPEESHFCIEMVYFYRDIGAQFGNSVECVKVHSLRAIARAKAVGLPLSEVDETSFDFVSPNGCTMRLIDDAHRRCDPIFEGSFRTNDLEETEHFWTDVMGIDIISKTEEDFVLFFGNRMLTLRYVKYEGEITHSDHLHLSFTLPKRDLLHLAKMIPEDFVFEPLRLLTAPERDADLTLILKDPNGYNMSFHDVESRRKIAKLDPTAATRLDLSLINEARYLENHKYGSM